MRLCLPSHIASAIQYESLAPGAAGEMLRIRQWMARTETRVIHDDLPAIRTGHLSRIAIKRCANKGKPTMKQTPLKKLNDGLISATVWVNKTQDGKDQYSITLLRSYLKDEQWHETSSFSGSEILRVGRLAETAYDFIRDHRNSEEKTIAAA